MIISFERSELGEFTPLPIAIGESVSIQKKQNKDFGRGWGGEGGGLNYVIT